MQRFTEISSYQKDVYFTALLSTAFATIFFIAPTSQHRLPWRRHARSQRLQLAHLLIIMGLLFLAVGMSCVVFDSFRACEMLDGDWVLEVRKYDSATNLQERLEKAVVRPALDKSKQLTLKKREEIRTRHINEY
jgi:Family of unknown function (DUF6328)